MTAVLGRWRAHVHPWGLGGALRTDLSGAARAAHS